MEGNEKELFDIDDTEVNSSNNGSGKRKRKRKKKKSKEKSIELEDLETTFVESCEAETNSTSNKSTKKKKKKKKKKSKKRKIENNDLEVIQSEGTEKKHEDISSDNTSTSDEGESYANINENQAPSSSRENEKAKNTEKQDNTIFCNNTNKSNNAKSHTGVNESKISSSTGESKNVKRKKGNPGDACEAYKSFQKKLVKIEEAPSGDLLDKAHMSMQKFKDTKENSSRFGKQGSTNNAHFDMSFGQKFKLTSTSSGQKNILKQSSPPRTRAMATKEINKGHQHKYRRDCANSERNQILEMYTLKPEEEERLTVKFYVSIPQDILQQHRIAVLFGSCKLGFWKKIGLLMKKEKELSDHYVLLSGENTFPKQSLLGSVEYKYVALEEKENRISFYEVLYGSSQAYECERNRLLKIKKSLINSSMNIQLL